MPSSVTHTYFGMDVYNRLDNKIKKLIRKDLEYYKVFCQGPDVFYFYNLFVGKKHKKVYKLGYDMHKYNSRNFFISVIEYITLNNLKDNGQVMSFLYGHMCHYFLDTACHPFIYYKTGKLRKNDKNTYKYNTKHADMEFFIDRFLINKKESVSPNKFKVHKMFLNINYFNEDLAKMVNEIINYKNASNIYLKSIKDMRLFFRLACYDRFKIKYYIYRFIDIITGIKVTKTIQFSYAGDYENNINYLNLEKKEWNHPCDKSIISNKSFFDLYDDALSECVNAISQVTAIIDSGKFDKKKLDSIFSNLSYLTGLDCDDTSRLKYFEY